MNCPETFREMKILHVWDCAGVGAILAKYQRRLGVQSLVVKRNGYSPYGIDKFYKTRLFDSSRVVFYAQVIKLILVGNFDIIHFHGSYNVVVFAWLFRKRIVFHFHGSELRNRGWFYSPLSKLAKVVLVSTPDMLNCLSNAIWIPTPIDTEHFHPKREANRKEFVESKKECKCKGKYKIYVDHADLPAYLRKFKKFKQLSWKVQGLSKLSLECLACGLTVFWNGLEIKGKLPSRHEALNVAKRTVQIYEGLMK